jgi:hypothetical protein
MLAAVASNRELRYRAGEQAYRSIRDGGFDPSMIRAFAGPASGPKWLVLAGIDRALIASELLSRPVEGENRPRLMVGASAGAWRATAMACADPASVHRQLEEGYVSQVFPRGVSATTISGAYRRMLSNLFPPPEIRRILDCPGLDVVVHVVRARGSAGSRRRRIQAATMACAAALNALSPRLMGLFFDRILFHSRPDRWSIAFDGEVAALTAGNFHDVALATGTVPLYMEAVSGIAGVGPGRHIDGGLSDYHLNQCYCGDADGVTLFPHFQERIVPNWFDRYLPWRRPSREVLSRVLQVYPSQEFVAGLPNGRIPTRDDFIEFVDDPQGRIRGWRQASAASDSLGEQLLDDIEHGRIPELVEAM